MGRTYDEWKSSNPEYDREERQQQDEDEAWEELRELQRLRDEK